MRQPEMLHSPAYYRDLGRRAPTYPQPVAVGTVSVTVPATSSPWVQPMSLTDNGGTGCSRPSSKASVAGRPESSIGGVGSRGSVLPAQQTFPLSSDAETSLPQPPKSASSHRVGDRSASVAASTSSRVVSSEGRADGTWANRSSYLADENSRKGVVSQIQRQPLQEEDLIAEQEANAVPMIFRLAILVPAFSVVAALYALLNLAFAVLIVPFRACAITSYLRSTTFKSQLCEFLTPALHIHERLVRLREPSSSSSSTTYSSQRRSSSAQWIYNDPEPGQLDAREDAYSASGLVFILMCSAFLSIPLVIVTMTAVFFWIFADIVGNPGGTERNDDGRAAVLGVARWWQKWLNKARTTSQQAT